MLAKTRSVTAAVALFALVTLSAARADDVKATDEGKGAEFKGKKFEMKDKDQVAVALSFVAGKEFEATTVPNRIVVAFVAEFSRYGFGGMSGRFPELLGILEEAGAIERLRDSGAVRRSSHARRGRFLRIRCPAPGPLRPVLL